MFVMMRQKGFPIMIVPRNGSCAVRLFPSFYHIHFFDEGFIQWKMPVERPVYVSSVVLANRICRLVHFRRIGYGDIITSATRVNQISQKTDN